MKYQKYGLLIIIIILIFTLVACGNDKEENTQDKTDSGDNSKKEVTFIGRIEEINGDVKERHPLGINTISVELIE